MPTPRRGESRYAGKGFIQCRERRGATRQSGEFTEKIFEGCREDIYGIKGDLVTAGGWDSWDIDHEGNKYTLKIRYADAQDENVGAEEIVNEVRLHATVQHIDIKALPQFSTVTRQEVRVIEAAIQKPEEASTLVVAPSDTEPAMSLADLSATALVLYNLYLRGVKNSPFYQPILERRRLAAATFNFTGTTSNAFENVGYVISPGSIEGDADLGTFLRFALPSGGQIIDAEGLIKNYGWLKDYPAYDYAAGNKAIVTQQWTWGLWAQDIYGVPI